MPAKNAVSVLSDSLDSEKVDSMTTSSVETTNPNYQTSPIQNPEILPGTDLPTSNPVEGEESLSDDVFASVTEMKLSDLIREGSSLFPQEYGWGDGVNAGCALTAGYVAAQNAGYRIKPV